MKNRKRKVRNPVARHMEKFNRPATHTDKKKQEKRRGPKVDLGEV